MVFTVFLCREYYKYIKAESTIFNLICIVSDPQILSTRFFCIRKVVINLKCTPKDQWTGYHWWRQSISFYISSFHVLLTIAVMFLFTQTKFICFSDVKAKICKEKHLKSSKILIQRIPTRTKHNVQHFRYERRVISWIKQINR